jgi:hypothetical protein
MIVPLPIIHFNSPIDFNQFRIDGKARPAVCPFEDVGAFGDFGAEHCSFGHHTNPSEVKPIRIPTGLNGNVGFRMAIGVEATSSEQVEIVIGQRKIRIPKLCRQFGTTFAVAIIAAFVDSPGVVKNGEKLNRFDVGTRFFSQAKPNFQNPCPMRNAMRPVDGQGVIFQDCVDKWFEVEHETILQD